MLQPALRTAEGVAETSALLTGTTTAVPTDTGVIMAVVDTAGKEAVQPHVTGQRVQWYEAPGL